MLETYIILIYLLYFCSNFCQVSFIAYLICLMIGAAAGGDLREYLEGLLKAGNMAEYVEQNPFGQERVDERSASWKFYLEVIDSLGKSCLSA